MDLACTPSKLPGLLLLPTSTRQCKCWEGKETITVKGRETWPSCWLVTMVEPGPALEPPAMFAKSAQRGSAGAQGPALHLLHCDGFCSLNQERSEGEMGRSQQKAGYIWHDKGFLWDLKKNISHPARSSTWAVSSVVGCSKMTCQPVLVGEGWGACACTVSGYSHIKSQLTDRTDWCTDVWAAGCRGTAALPCCKPQACCT